MLVALTHAVSPHITNGETTFIERQPIDYELALKQHAAYCQTIEKSGAQVKQLSVNLDAPDSCFIEDTAIVLDEVAIITRMGVPSRQHESAAIAPTLAQYREIVRIEPPGTLEGGDVLRMGRRLYVGLSGRTNLEGIRQLTQILQRWNYDVISVELRNTLHLKTACTAIDDQTILLNPVWVTPETFAAYNVVTIPPDEAWAANTIRIGDRLFLQQGFPRTLELILKYQEAIEILDISEFNKVEGGLSCLSIIFPDMATSS